MIASPTGIPFHTKPDDPLVRQQRPKYKDAEKQRGCRPRYEAVELWSSAVI